jgi:hypothetical protein
MKIKEGNPHKLIVAPNEKVTVSIVQSVGLAASVDYALADGSFKESKPKDQAVTIPIPGNANLAMTVFFTGNSGGSFKIRMTGDGGGDVSEISDTQAPGSGFKIIGYRFSLQ